MNRYTAWIVAFASVAMLLSNPVDASAATKKKKPATDTSSDDSSTPAPKKSATPPLDLPLPAQKGTDGATPPPAKTGEKTATEPKGKNGHAPNATVEPEEITEFVAQPPRVQQLLRDAIDLTRLDLTYTFGSADPDSGGMDCSGTIYYLLHAHNFADTPRDSSGQYLWTRKGGAFFPVVSKNLDSVEFKELLPGDLMFWTGTYNTAHEVPISHVMMYLGREKSTGKRIMFGASDGRSYNGIQRWGVSVFDFKMPKPDAAGPEKSEARFIGFARIPGLRGPALPASVADTDATDNAKKDSATPTPTPKSNKLSGTKTSHKKKKVDAD
jgi:cell wall-associated NlpC family hydrolase